MLSVALVSTAEVARPEDSGGEAAGGRRVLCRVPVAIGVPAVGPRPPLGLAQALALVRGEPAAGLDLGLGPGKYELMTRDSFVGAAAAGQLRPGQIAAVRLEDLSATVAALAVDGVLPEPGTANNGGYPLSVTVSVFWAGNTLPAARRLWAALTRSELAYAADFVRWLEGPEARTALFGVGELVSLSAVGDVMLDRGVGRWIERSGPDYPFDATRGLLANADIAVCNLESPLGTGGRQIADKAIWFRARPESGLGLVRAGIDLVCLANNHTLDYGREGLMECLDHLNRLGLTYFGAGRDLSEARAPAVVTCRGVKVAFLGYSEFADMYWSVRDRFTFEATGDRPGVAPLRQPYQALHPAAVAAANPHLADDIAAARAVADVVVVSVHWGVEYTNEPSSFQRLAAQFILDAGADLILGHHPHAVQGLLPAGGGLAAFSLGNFVFDQPWPQTQESMVLQVQLSSRGVFRWDLAPVQISACQPRAVSGWPEGDALRAKIIGLSWNLYLP